MATQAQQSFTHAPFPDVTGLRTAWPGYSRIAEENEYISVEHRSQLSSSCLNAAGRGQGDSLVAAWASILYHYGSHEASNVEVVEVHPDTKRSLIALDLEQAKTESYDADKLVNHVSSRRSAAVQVAEDVDHGYAAIITPDEPVSSRLPAAFKQLSLQQNRHLSLVLAAYSTADSTGSERLVLAIKASPAVHTQESATLQLQQVAALLSSLAQPSDQPALSLERFDMSLRAGDNPDYVHLPAPDYLQGRHHDRLECEFEYFAEMRPNDVALDFRYDLKDETQRVIWTYAEMNARADAVRDLLWSHGVGSVAPDDGSDHIVALYLEKSPETYLSFLSVIKAGAAWCPIDTDWPASRRQALLAKSKAKVVLTAGDAVSAQLDEDLTSDDMKENPMQPIRLDQVEVNKDGISQNPAQLAPRSDAQLAYMIWTSGTTGLPKGVGIQHQAIIQAMRALRQKIPFGKKATGTDKVRYLQYSAYNFDLSIMDCFYAWGIGGTICSCTRGLLLQDLVAVGTSFKPTHTLLTPAVMAMTERNLIPSLRVVINGGEKLSQVVADEWSKDCCLLNLYGPAEATLIAMNRRVPLGDHVKAPNIGVALPTVSCHALDKSDQVVLKGAVGELVLGGPQLARGYVGDPVKTADKFFSHPQLGRVYRTGDQVRQLGNAEFEYLGRIDDQVKINGIRIELLEINAAIKNSHAHVKDSETMAFPRPGSDAELQIINFSVLPHDSNSSADSELLRTDDQAVQVARQLQQAARQSLPSYMLPSMFIILSRFPRTSSAKIDRVALKQVLAGFDSLSWENRLAGDGDADDADVPPSAAEECMRKWIAKLCSVAPDRIGRNTPFTSIGLDSIRAITFSQRLLQDGFAVSVVDVAQYPTLRQLSRQLESSASQAEEKRDQARQFFARFDESFRPAVLEHLNVASDKISAILPCTPLQEGMLAESQLDSLAYRIQRQYRLARKFDADRLNKALDQVIQDFESLRTNFVDVGCLRTQFDPTEELPFQPVFLQAVWTRASAQVLQLDVPKGAELESAVLRFVKERASVEPFGRQPPVAFLLVKHGNDETSLVFVAHHSVYDARSLALIEERLERHYSGSQQLDKVYQFSTALAHIIPLTSEDRDERQQIWEQALTSFPRGEISRFPNLSGSSSRSAREQRQLHRAAYRKATVSWKQLEEASRRLGISARPLVQVAWARVLSAYLDTDHLIIGDSVSGRSAAAELDQVVGPVLSTLPVAVYLRAGRTVAQVAREVDEFHRGVFPAQHTHLAALRRVLGLPAGQPMFHSVFVFEPAPEVDGSHPANRQVGLALTKIADLGVATEHPLGVEVQPDTDGNLRLGISWQRSQVADEFGALLLDQFDACLSSVSSAVDVEIGALLAKAELPSRLLSISSEEKEASSIREAEATNVASFVSNLPADVTDDTKTAVEIHAQIPASATDRRPSASISYRDLDKFSSRAASLLAHLPRNSVVGVCLERSLESYIYPLAILKAGHAYLPLDETLPLERKKLLLSDSGARGVVTSSSAWQGVEQAVADLGLETILIADDDKHQAKLAASDIYDASAHQVGPDDLAFIIYTSGSTGKPKGCLLTHGNLASAIEAFRLVYEREAPGSFAAGTARFLARSAEAFDVHLLEIFLTLRHGGTIVTGPRPVIHEDIGRTIAVLEVTHACVVPSLFFGSRGERVRPEQVPSLRALIIGGEALTSDLCELWGTSNDEIKAASEHGRQLPVVLNAYGPSEATIGTSIARVTKRSVTGNIGRPFAGTRYLVLREVNSQLSPTLRGEAGELCIGGAQVAKGYLNRPDLNSFVEWQGQWIYRTGDMVRLNAADEAEYLGRIDGGNQVKVRGARLELGEVDAALRSALSGLPQMPTGSGGTVVTVLAEHPGIEGSARLVSFVASGSERVDASNASKLCEDLWLRDTDSVQLATGLRKAVRTRLPQYMVPSLVLALRRIPLSPLSGKVNSKALQDLYQAIDVKDLQNITGGASDVREMNEDEKRVTSVLRELLRLSDEETVHPEMDLIALGLDSLTVVTFAGRLRQAGFSVSAASIMNDPTVAAIAAAGRRQLDSATTATSSERRAAFDERVRSLTAKAAQHKLLAGRVVAKVVPCLPLQTALIAQASAESAGNAPPRYVTTVIIDVHGGYKPDQIAAAWNQVLTQHEIYRTVFVEIDDQVCQVVLGSSDKENKLLTDDFWIDGAAATSVHPWREETLPTYHGDTARQIVSAFGEKPPLRLRLWQDDGERLKLTLTCSHAIYDGTSLGRLLREVGEHLEHKQDGQTGIATTQHEFHEFSDVVGEIFGQQSLEEIQQFWTQNLDGFSRSPVPVLTGLRQSKGTKAGSEADELTVRSSHSFSMLEAAARVRGITVHSLLVSAYCRLLAEYLGEDDVTIGLVLGGRTLAIEGIEALHGPCVTTVPFRMQHARKTSAERLSRDAHKAINELLPYQHVSLPDMMRWLELDQPPFEALFSYLGVQGPNSTSSVLVEKDTIMERDYPLAVEASIVGDSVQLHVAFSDRVLPRDHAALFLNQLDSVIQAIADGDSESGSKLPEKQVSAVNRNCYVPSNDAESFLARFQRHAREQPEAVAVVFAETLDHDHVTMSYAELDQLSETMATRLVTYDSPIIGVHLNKDGPRLYAAMLAVWKAGKTYLPLDPSLPEDRLRYMLETVGQAPAITSVDTKATLAGSKSQTIDIDELMQPVYAGQSDKLPSISLKSPCYLLFTSGSTGRPKAVQISHQALSGAIYSWERMLPWSKSSRFLQLASIGFDVSLIEVCMPLSLGFSIGTAPKSVLIEDLTTAINRLGITIADLPAALAGTVHPDDVKLEWLMSGGDAIDERVIQDWASDSAPERILINAWGPTETTIGSSLGRVRPGSSRSVVGEVYPACSMFVLKEDSVELALRGAVGELAVGGPQVADKYYGREDLTAEKFVYLHDGTRIYRTGDRGRFLIDGNIECLGRIGADRQVKVNGQRVELDEISQALVAHRSVRDADVQYLKHPGMSAKQLVAFIAPGDVRTSSTITLVREDAAAVQLVIALKQDAVKRLAPYMIPSQWLVLDGSLPLTPNNKVDHKALASVFTSSDPSLLGRLGSMREDALSQTPWTPQEERLRSLIAGFCSIPESDIAKTTSFHRLGIDSITAIRLVKHLREAGYRLTVADVMSSPYISSLAEKHASKTSPTEQSAERSKEIGDELQRRLASKVDIDQMRLGSYDRIIALLPCTPLQAGMITQTLASAGKLYFHHHAYAVASDHSAVRQAWQRLVDQLDILRTTFHQSDDSEHPWIQVVHATGQKSLPKIVEHSGLFDSTVSNQLDHIEGQPSFDNDGAFAQPPHVLHLWRQADGNTVLLLSIHHALYDAASLPQLFVDMETVLRGDTGSDRAPFYKLVPHLLPSKRDTEFWAEQLHGFRPKLLRPSDGIASDGGSVEGTHAIKISLDAVKQACAHLGVSVQVLATLAYAKLLAVETGSGDVAFGQIFGLRDLVNDGETSVGPALNTVATRVRLDQQSCSAAQQLQQMQQSNDAGRPHRKAALRDVQQAVARSSGSKPPLFDALFDFQKEVDITHKEADSMFQSIPLKSEDGSPQYALNVEFIEGTGGLSLYSTADAAVYSQDALDSLLGRLEAIFVQLATETQAPLSAMPVDQAALPAAPALATATSGSSSANAAEETRSVETVEGRKLAEVIAIVAGVAADQIYASSRLSTLGLDSISAIRIASLARKQGLAIGVADIVSGETVEGIIAKLAPGGKQRQEQDSVARDPLHSAEARKAVETQLGYAEAQVERILPLLPGQTFSLANWLNSGKRSGVFSWAYRATGELDAQRLGRAWESLQKRHAILRTAFVSVNAAALQVVRKASESMIPLREVAIPTGAKLEDNVRTVIREATHASWDLARPPVQLTLLQGKEESGVVLSIHHVLYDAFSVELLVHDLQVLYTGGDGVSSSNKHLSSADWIGLVDHLNATTDRAAADMYWKQTLAGTAQPAILGDAGAQSDEEFSFHANILRGYQAYEAKLKAAQVSLQALFLAGWSQVLSESTGLESPLFGVYHLGRSSSFDGVERVAGPCMSILPMSLSASASGAVVDLAREAATQLRQRAQFEQTDLGAVHRAAGLATDRASYNTYVNVLIPRGSETGATAGLLERMHVGHPTDFAPAQPLEAASTVDALGQACLVQTDVSIDVVLDAERDAVSVGVKAVRVNHAHLVARLVSAVRGALESL